jgi:hypothetical protein
MASCSLSWLAFIPPHPLSAVPPSDPTLLTGTQTCPFLAPPPATAAKFKAKRNIDQLLEDWKLSLPTISSVFF